MVKLSKSAAVDVRSVEMVVAVEMLCPNMKSVEFADSGVVTEDATLPLMLQVALLSSNYQQVSILIQFKIDYKSLNKYLISYRLTR